MDPEKNDSKEEILLLTKQDWQPLLDLIPEIEKTVRFGEISKTEIDSDGAIQLPFYEESSVVSRFRELVYKLPVIVNFDWMSWDKGRKIAGDESFDFDTIDIPEKCKVITAIVRSDRFCEGALVNAFESGVILKILKSIENQLL